MTNKKKIIEIYKRLIGILTTLSAQLDNLKFNDPKLEEARERMVKLTREEASKIQKDAIDQLDKVVWDRLVIAFFGETNAGKSTIIESLRILLNEESREKEREAFTWSKSFKKGARQCTDGTIVGDGRQDYTKDYHEYKMTFNGHPFVLIDVPGIEGNESAYTDGISRALGKAHCVFYVNGNETTNEATAKKIIKYLNEWVKVNVIYNVRNNADAYEFEEDRVSLISPRVQKSVQILDRSFRNYLGQHFEGVIPVQGLLAMSSHAEFSPKREDLVKLQQKLHAMFAEDLRNGENAADKIREFSHVMDLVKLIDRKSKNFTEEIRQANMLKITTIGRRIYQAVCNHISVEGIKFNNYARIIHTFRLENVSIGDNAVQMFKRAINTNSKRMLEELKKNGYRCIESGRFKDIDILFKKFKTSFDAMIKDEAAKIIGKFANDIKLSADRLSEIPGVSVSMLGDISFANFNMPSLNTNAISRADNINFGDVMKAGTSTVGGASAGAFAGGIIGSVIPFVGTALGAWVGGILGGGTGLVSGSISAGEDQTRRAKKILGEQIDIQQRAVDYICEDGCRVLKNKLSFEINRINACTQSVYDDIMCYMECLNNANKSINDFITEVTK